MLDRLSLESIPFKSLPVVWDLEVKMESYMGLDSIDYSKNSKK
jgi:hypothetical protein